MFLQEDENMQENILRDSLVTHIFLSYMEAGKKQVVRVKLRFIDTRQAYFSAPPPIKLMVFTKLIYLLMILRLI